jgi:hypothetical protein
MNDPFLARVSFAGVPHTLDHSESVEQATLYPLAPSQVCRLYWMLTSLTATYSYSINGISVSRNFSVESRVPPKNRLLAPAAFYVTEYYPNTQTAALLELHLNVVYFDGTDNSKIGLNLMFEEMDNLGIINLCLRQISGMASVTFPFTFAGTDLVAYLNHNQSQVSSATLDNFAITPRFFEI